MKVTRLGGGRDSSVGIVSSYRLGAEELGFNFMPGQKIFLVSRALRPALGPTQPPIECLAIGGSFLRIKWLGGGGNHPFPPTWTYISTFPTHS